MIGIVIAAGYGTRLKPYTDSMPKSLVELEHGVAVIDYIMKLMAESGIGEVYIATREELREVFASRVPSNKIVVVDVTLNDGNLWTLYQAIEKLREMEIVDDIIVTMSDHVYEAGILKSLIRAAGREGDKVLLCLDRSVRGEEAIEGLKVVVDGSAVVLTGKDIPPLSGVDTGLFYIPKTLFEEIRRVVEIYGRRASLSNFVNVLAEKKLVGFVDVTGLRWIDIDTVEDLAKARRIYWDIVRRNLVKDSDGVVSKYINRRISTRISTYLYRNGIYIEPSIITVLVFIIGMAGAAAVYLGIYVLGGILALTSSILDGVDGEIARLFNRQTEFGAILDTTLDRIVDTLLITGVIYQGFKLGELSLEIGYLTLSSLALLGSIYVSFISNLVRDREPIARARASFPWPTRDVRVTVIALALIFHKPLLGLLYILLSSWSFITRAIVYIARDEGRQRPGLIRFIKRGIPKPVILTPIRIAIHDVIRDILILVFLMYAATLGLEYLHRYLTEGMPTIVWELLLAAVVALMTYFTYRAAVDLWHISIRVRDVVVRHLWVTPTVYERIAVEFIVLLTLILLRYPMNYCLLMLKMCRLVIDVVNYALSISIVLLSIVIAIEIIRVVEHKIHNRVSKFLKQ